MAGMNTPTIPAAQVNELLQDEQHITKFEAFQAENIVAGYITEVDRLAGYADMVPITMGAIGVDDPLRSSRVATDDPTPKGNTAMAQMPFVCNEYRFAEPLSQVAGQSLESFFNSVETMLQTRAGLRVKVDVEKEIINILKGLGSTATYTGATIEDISTTARKWNNYTGASHDPYGDLITMQVRTGATKLFLGLNVALALCRSPVFTGADAGSGANFLTIDGLRQVLAGMGFSEVIIGHLQVHGRAPELPYQLKDLHDGVAAMWAPGAIRMFRFEEFQYDSWVDEDRRKEYYRALQTSVFKVPYPQMLGVFQNVLQ